MRSNIEGYNTLAKQLKQEYPKLSDFEILSLSIQIERNQILENGLNVNYSDKSPSALEAIAIALGFTNDQFQTTVTDVLKDIANKE
jgi:hypothetical protein